MLKPPRRLRSDADTAPQQAPLFDVRSDIEAAPNQAPTFGATALVRVSTDSAGAELDGTSFDPVFSPDGSKIAFRSNATDLFAGDTNGAGDVFVKDLASGVVTRLSTDAGGTVLANNYSVGPVFLPDGTRVAFTSAADNLVAGDSNGQTDIFIRDLVSGAIELVSTDGADAQLAGASADPVFSPDGSKMAFSVSDGVQFMIYLKDLTTGSLTLVAGGGSLDPVFSPDGTKLLYRSASGLGGPTDLLLKDLATGTAVVVSTDAFGTAGNGDSFEAAFSPDGNSIAFSSTSSNLVVSDDNAMPDVFLKDLVSGTVYRVSRRLGSDDADAGSFQGTFSPDGTQVAFMSDASNLIDGDTNGDRDIFVRDLATGTISRASFGPGGAQASGDSEDPVFSPDGASIAFWTSGALVAEDGNGVEDIYVVQLRSTFTENGAPVQVAPKVHVSDADSASYAGGTLTVFISGGFVAGDTLSLALSETPGVGVGRSGTDITHNGITVGTLTAGTTTLTFSLDGSADDAAVAAIAEAVRFASISEDPTAAVRRVTFTLADGGGTADGGSDTTSFFRTVAVKPVNDAPVIATSAGKAAHVEGADGADTRVVLDPGFTIADVDGGEITTAWLNAIVGAPGDWLDFVNDDSAAFGDIHIHSQTIGALMLLSDGGASQAQWQNALRAVTYQTTDDAPIEGDRTIIFTLRQQDEYGKGILSNSVVRQVSVAAGNDRPVNSVPGAQQVDENHSLVFSAADGNAITVADPDVVGASMIVTISVLDGALRLAEPYAFSTGDGTNRLWLRGSIDQVNEALDGLTYTPPANANGPRTITVNTGDHGFTGSPNLIVNPGAEAGTSATDFSSVVPPAGWTFVSGAMTALAYDIPGDGNLTHQAPAYDGEDYFAGGPTASDSILRQLIDVGGHAADIDAGIIQANLWGTFGGRGGEADTMILAIRFRGGGGQVLGILHVGGVAPSPESLLALREGNAMVPAGTRSIEVFLFADHVTGAHNDAYADLLSLTLSKVDIDTIAVQVVPDAHDIVHGTPGADTLAAGPGNDSYFVDHAGDTVIEAAGEGQDIVFASVNWTLAAGQEVEILATVNNLATTPLALTGNEHGNLIVGNAGANLLSGGAGADYLDGRAGDDSYFVDHVYDRVIEAAGGGYDIVYASASFTATPGQEIEVLGTANNLADTALNLTGNERGDFIVGNNGANTLDGGAGRDYLDGRGGDDSYVVDDSGDTVLEGAGRGNDIVFAGVSYGLAAGQEVETLATVNNLAATAIDLTGNELNNFVSGNEGANRIDGGAGRDYLDGRGGADSYAFATALGGSNVDTILSFESGADRILLDDAIFAGLAPGALAATAFVTGAAAQDSDDRIVHDSATGALFFDSDGAGGAAAVQFASVAAGTSLAASDFAVI